MELRVHQRFKLAASTFLRILIYPAPPTAPTRIIPMDWKSGPPMCAGASLATYGVPPRPNARGYAVPSRMLPQIMERPVYVWVVLCGILLARNVLLIAVM